MSVSTLILDGGGSSTDVAVVRSGRICARTELSAFKPTRHDARTDELCRAIGGFLATAHLTQEESNIRFCVLGMSGVWSDHERTEYANSFCDAWMQYVDHALPAVRVMSDVELALVAALGTQPGVVLIAGTGSIAVSRSADGQLTRCGGWGPRLDDEGGGFWMGREALRAVARMIDGRSPETLLIRPVAAYLRCDPKDLPQLEANLRSVSIDGAARLARAVLTYAEEGDEVSSQIARRGAAALCEITLPLVTDGADVVLHGSLLSSDFYRSMLLDMLSAGGKNVNPRRLEDLIEAIAPQLRAE